MSGLQLPGAPGRISALPAPDEDEDALDRPVLRERLLRQFSGWLDEALCAPGPLPEALQEMLREVDALEQETVRAEQPDPHRPGADLYGLWSAVTAVTQEVKLQGRFFKELSDGLKEADMGGLRAALDSQGSVLAQLRDGDQEQLIAARQDAQRESIELLVDLRDRLLRGADAAARHAAEAERASRLSSWLSRLFPRRRRRSRVLLDAAQGLQKGSRLTLARLDEALDRLDVRPIDCNGQPFDPRLMTAVDIEETDDVDEGIVLEVYRSGYERADQLLRPAQVKVARRRSRGGKTNHE